MHATTTARYVTAQVRASGKHFLPRSLLVALHEMRRRQAGRDALLDAFLHCALDKHDGRFWNRSYLALPVLERLVDDELDAERMATLLVADIVRHETASTTGRPEPATLRKRLRHAVRFMADELEPHAFDALMASPADEQALRHLPAPPARVAEWFELTVQPVSVVHDEYFFIRVLQAHEMLFTAITEHQQAAIRQLRAGSPEFAAESVDHARRLLERAAGLFRIAATMRPEAFLHFRDYTQGASAIQSEQYKLFELLCGPPPAARARSAAFTNVPAVRAADSLTAAYGDAATRTPAMDDALAALESSHQRWKTAHHSLAARMLGDAPGSGYTAGVPYLKDALENRLFGGLGDGCPFSGAAQRASRGESAV